METQAVWYSCFEINVKMDATNIKI